MLSCKELSKDIRSSFLLRKQRWRFVEQPSERLRCSGVCNSQIPQDSGSPKGGSDDTLFPPEAYALVLAFGSLVDTANTAKYAQMAHDIVVCSERIFCSARFYAFLLLLCYAVATLANDHNSPYWADNKWCKLFVAFAR